ncbi:MAG: DUF502 domain-containing protein [Hyphomicrobium sp.]
MWRITRVFLAGLLSLLPLIVTAIVTGWVVSILNEYAGPNSWFGQLVVSLGLSVGASSFAPYVIGLVILVSFVYALGLFVESRLGSWVTNTFERFVSRIPVISSVYDISKKFTSMVDLKGGGDLKNMRPVWCFFGGEPGAAVLALMPSSKPVQIGKDKYVGIIIPSAPVPVGGALLYVPQTWIKAAAGGVDELMAVYISMGVTSPTSMTVT